MSQDDSVTQWIVDLKDGDDSAAQQLWDRYFKKLAVLAEKRLSNVPRLPNDGEDVALSAMHSLCKGMNAGRFADLSDREGLWKLLVAITVRKANHTLRDAMRQKRGGGKVVGESVFLNRSSADAGSRGLEMALSMEPSPQLAVEIEEEVQRLFHLLPDEELKNIATWKMQGLTSAQISEKLGKALATIERRLKLIRSLWAESEAN